MLPRNLFLHHFPHFVQEGISAIGGTVSSGVSKVVQCFACQRKLDGANATGDDQTPSVCGGCKSIFCFQCDVYIHEKLHNCPGCENQNAGC
mmetsp:Transcript_13837/g.22632  ORF Transcript_13837/g.22632 Transcript_13837/m.22632 type:complete len:91 (+) Transcript_13837:417-689(+)